MITDDIALLQEYAQSNSEQAFATLVSRHVNLVYSVALRQVNDPHLAEEVTQATFILLAKKASSFDSKAILSGWLCRTARYSASNALKMQRRRQQREQEAYMDSLSNDPGPDVWQQIAPHLEEAMSCLGEKDHNAIVLRYFEGKDLREVGLALGTNADTARMRVTRAVDKLRTYFTKRGITVSAGVFASTLSAKAIQSAPEGLATTATMAAVEGAAVTSSTMLLVQSALKGAVLGKSGSIIMTKLVGLSGTLAGPALGVASGILAHYTSRETARIANSPRLKAEISKYSRRLWVGMLFYFSVIVTMGWAVKQPYGKAHPVLLCVSFTVFTFAFSAATILAVIRNHRMNLRLGSEELSVRAMQRQIAYEYRSRWTFLGLPLVHIRTNCIENGKILPAKGWIAIGTVAYGVLFADGLMFSVGIVSMGGFAIGLISCGGTAIGGLAMGALAIGYRAVGGAALGIFAVGGSTLAWIGAFGGAAVAGDYALGYAVYATHANDAAAQAFGRGDSFLRYIWIFPFIFGMGGVVTGIRTFFRLRKMKQQKSVQAGQV